MVASFSARSAKSRPGSSSGSSDRARSYICANSDASSSSPSPAAAAASRTSSDSSRNFSGSRLVHKQISRPTDSGTCPAASAATTRGWVRVRPAQAACPTAAPRVIPVRWISHDTALYSASPAYPCPAVNAASTAARAAVATAPACSSPRRHSACVAADSWLASAAAR